MKGFLLVVILLTPVFCCAQFKGGNNDGTSQGAAIQQNALPPIYAGGTNDGHGSQSALGQNALPSIYGGGVNDGVALASVSGQNALPGIYAGGSNDGVASLLVSAQNSLLPIYTGGTNDGVALVQATGQNALPSIYKGSTNDGVASLSVTGQNALPQIYAGGVNDGTSMLAVTSLNSLILSPCIRLRVYLEGPLAANGNQTAPDGRPLMRDNLRNSPFSGANYIPIKDPYEFSTVNVNVTSKYTKLAPQDALHPQFQQISDSAGVFGITGQNAIVDWVFVELRSKANSSAVVTTRAALLQRDGDVVELDGAGCLSFLNANVDSYYVAIRHRNHLGAMTKFAQSFASLSSLVDFTPTSTPLFDFGTTLGNGADYTGLATNNGVIAGYRALWAGDFNADKKVKYDNPQGDDNTLFFEVLNDPANVGGVTNFSSSFGYWQGDYNMDSRNKYDNPQGDDNRLLFQVLNYPLNTLVLTNYSFFLQQLP